MLTLGERLMEQGREEGLEQGLEQGREEGLEQGRDETSHEIATKMLADGLSLETISMYTGLSLKDLEKLKA